MPEVLGSWVVTPQPCGMWKAERVYRITCINCENSKLVRLGVLHRWRNDAREARCGKCRMYAKGFRRVPIEQRALKLARQMLVLMLEQMGVDDASHVILSRTDAATAANGGLAQLPDTPANVRGRKAAK